MTSLKSTVEGQVAKFPHIIGHNMKNRSVPFFFFIILENYFLSLS